MTCLVTTGASDDAVAIARELFDAMGTSVVIEEELMASATALAACGVAFFLRAIRAASQGGIEIGFRAEDAIAIAAQTAKARRACCSRRSSIPSTRSTRSRRPAAAPSRDSTRWNIQGFSSALIQGITVSAENAAKLYDAD